MISKTLLQAILGQYQLPLQGVHGAPHWARVLENGRLLAQHTGADLPVVVLFAVLHDSKRLNENFDHKHGQRAADFAASLQGKTIQLSEDQFKSLYAACAGHTDGKTAADVTVQTCWDSDRLDLGRVGMKVNPKFLCTPAAKDPSIISWASQRARAWLVPDLIQQEWGLDLSTGEFIF
jgi:uncharacterized protein